MKLLQVKKQPGPTGRGFNPFLMLRSLKVFDMRSLAILSLAIFVATILGFPFQSNFSPTGVKPASSNSGSISTPATKEKALRSYGQLPLSFELNQGQSESQARYLSRGTDYALFLTGQEMVLDLTKSTAASKDISLDENDGNPLNRSDVRETSTTSDPTGASLRMKWLGGSTNPPVSGVDRQEAITNYLVGNDPSKWLTNVPNYGKVDYQEIYPGIDLTFYGNQQQLEYDFTVKPQGDPNMIRLSFEGASGLVLNAAGELVVYTRGGDIVQPAPHLYQELNNTRQEVEGRFKLLTAPDGLLPVFGFEIGAYDSTRPLVIDPVLVYSTYLGGSASDSPGGLAIDSGGNAYITGIADSTNFPVTAGAYQTTCGCNNSDAFVTKLNATGTALVYSTFLGGNSTDEGTAIAVDSTGNAYLTGYTLSANFPVTAGTYQTTLSGGNDAFVTKLNATGTALIYSTFLGGGGLDPQDLSRDIAIDASGNAFVAGTTQSPTFPVTTGAFQTTFVGSEDAFVTKFNAAGTSLIYSTFLHNDTYANQIVVDTSGNAFVAGSTFSTTFPATAGAYDTVLNGNGDGFISKFNAAGSSLIYSTFLGGSGNDLIYGMSIDSVGNAFVTGTTVSTDFPATTGAYQTTLAGDGNAFVTKLNVAGTGIIYSTYLGGTGLDSGQGIALDSSGNAYIIGYGNSTNFPTTVGAFQTTSGGYYDTYLSKLNSNGTALLYSTYLGGIGGDFGYKVKVDSGGNVYLTGTTSSNNFPITGGAYQTTKGASYSAIFITRFSLGTSKTCVVNNTSDNAATSGTLRNALSQSPKCDIINFNFTSTSTTFFNIVGTALPAVPVGVTINGVCSNGKPVIVINGNITGIGLYLSGGDTVSCLEIAGFQGAGLKAAGGAGSNKLFQVKVSRMGYA